MEAKDVERAITVLEHWAEELEDAAEDLKPRETFTVEIESREATLLSWALSSLSHTICMMPEAYFTDRT